MSKAVDVALSKSESNEVQTKPAATTINLNIPAADKKSDSESDNWSLNSVSAIEETGDLSVTNEPIDGDTKTNKEAPIGGDSEAASARTSFYINRPPAYKRYPGVRGLFYPPVPSPPPQLYPAQLPGPGFRRNRGVPPKYPGLGYLPRLPMGAKSSPVGEGSDETRSPESVGGTRRRSDDQFDFNNNAMLSPSSAVKMKATVPPPLIYVAPTGTISAVLSGGIVVETSVDRAVRVICHDKFAAAMNARGTASAILHTHARLLHAEDKVFSKFMSASDKMAVLGPKGVLFTMAHLSEAFLVSSSFSHKRGGASAVALDQLCFPAMKNDFTIHLFYTEAQTGVQYQSLCEEIVRLSTYDSNPLDGSVTLFLNGLCIRQEASGEVSIVSRPRQIVCSPANGTISLRSVHIDMAVQDVDKAYVKKGAKRVHVSRSGMVVSDGNSITSMDHAGRIVSSM